ncbi:MAG TPA: crossover junction endodeoxyribonuclease RuvC [Halothiobacillus sp.]|nr:crossover junction endodeoxyribonuclease RuvC [Halothiobacillus sp.]HQS30056.1 crossover junction endodeoxyribonuclease RuvC [Halothiobacillus sp.]
MARLRVLGVDPGSVTLGVAVIDFERGNATCVHLESVALKAATKATGDFHARLGAVFFEVNQLITQFSPDEFAIEQIFMFRSPESSLKLAQARGAAIAAAVQGGLNVHEYMPATVKQAVVGTGRADKLQVQHMVKRLLNLSEAPPADGADAAAIALCHCYRRTSLITLQAEHIPPAKAELLRHLAQSRHRSRSGQESWTELAMARARKPKGDKT